MKNKNKGFTLIELITVIAIIGILATIVVVSLNDIREKSMYNAALASARELTKSMYICYTEGGHVSEYIVSSPPIYFCTLGSSYGAWPAPPKGWSWANDGYTDGNLIRLVKDNDPAEQKIMLCGYRPPITPPGWLSFCGTVNEGLCRIASTWDCAVRVNGNWQ